MTLNRRGTDKATITANDRVVLNFVLKAAHPMSACDILDLMRPDRPRIAPPTVYRALARLAALGLVHRVKTLNAWFAPAMASPQGSAIITICDDCGDVGEYAAPEALSAIAGALEVAIIVARSRIACLPQQAEIDRSYPKSVRNLVAMGLWAKIGPFARIRPHTRTASL